MATARVVLEQVQLLVFLGAALAALRSWSTRRGRPAAFLATAFGTTAFALLVSRTLPVVEGAPAELGRDLVVVALSAFPWFLALFAWSFEPRLPRWLIAAGAAPAALALWSLVRPPIPPAGARGVGDTAFVVLFIAVWSALSALAAVRLWRAGGDQPLVRARMRTMAAGALVLTGALILVGNRAEGQELVATLATLLSILAASLFTAGFAPPRFLRLWWRRRVTERWQEMQLELIAAATPAAAAASVVPLLADLVGGGAAVIGPDGRLLAAAGLSDRSAQDTADRVRRGEACPDVEEWLPLDDACLVVRRTPYTPLFGQDERDLVAGFALQLRLALQRAELFAANERIRADLEQAHEELQTMMIGLAHDLRSPSVAIGGYGRLLRSSEDEAERRELLDGIERSADYLSQLVDSLVELSRAGRVRLTFEPVDLQAVVSGVAERLRASRPDVRTSVSDLPTVEGNRLALEQVFENLLTNAVRHGGRDALTVAVACREVRAGTAVIDVCDDGRGIHPDDRDRVFAPFRRGRDAAPGGNGVGLGLVRRLLEHHGGDIELEDRAAGACFRIRLPVHARTHAPERATATAHR